MPKAASSTVFELMYALGSRNGFAVDSRPMYLPRAPGGVARADAIVPHGAPPMNTTLEQYMRWSAKLLNARARRAPDDPSLGDTRRYAARPLRTVHTAHGPYLDFTTVPHGVRRLSAASYANTPPASAAAAVPYFGLMRMPLERLASHYDYIHWGPRSKWATLWKGQDTSALPFASCAARLAAASADTTPRVREAAAGCELARFANVQVLRTAARAREIY